MKINYFFSTRVLLMALLLLASVAPLKADEISIDASTFPDANFRYFVRYLLFEDERTSGHNDFDGYTENPFQDGKASQADFDKVTHIYLDDMKENGNKVKIKDLTGIKNFRNLKKLIVDGHELTKLDLSGMDQLQELEAHHNQLTHLDISGCVALHTMNIMDNCFTWREMSYIINNLPVEPEHGVGAWGTLRAYESTAGADEQNQLTETHVHNARNLKRWEVYHGNEGPTKGSEVYKVVNVDRVGTDETPSPDFNDFIIKDRVYVKGNQDHVTYVSNPDIPDISFGSYLINNYFSSTAVRQQMAADYEAGWYCYHLNRINSGKIGIDYNPLNGENHLTWDDIYYITNLQMSNRTTKIKDLTGIQKLFNVEKINCQKNEIATLDLSNMPKLQTVYAGFNQITSVNVDGCEQLSFLGVEGNKITESKFANLINTLPDRKKTSQGSIRVHYTDYNNETVNDDNAISSTQIAQMLIKNWNPRERYTRQGYDTKNDTYDQYRNYLGYDQLEDIYIGGWDENFKDFIYNQAYSKNYNVFGPAIQAGYFEGNPFIDKETKEPLEKVSKFALSMVYFLDMSDYKESKPIASLEDGNTDPTKGHKNKGIREFVNLEQLNVNGHDLTSLDVSGMKKLRILRCHEVKDENHPGLSSLNVEGCDSLHQIYCDRNALTSLDVTSLANLQMLRCQENPTLTALDVTHNPKLYWLDCYNCDLDKLDVTKNPELEVLYCYVTRDNEATEGTTRTGRLPSLDLSKNPKLKQLRCSNQPNLSTLDLSNNNALEILYCNNIDYSNGQLQANLANKLNLRQLSCYSTNISALDVSANTNLKELICYNNSIKTLDLSANTALETLICGDNQKGVDGRNAYLPNGGNPITTLDVSKNINLKTLRCAKMNLVALDLTGLTQLENLNYADQVRKINAENAMFKYLDESNNVQSKNIYYLRLDENRSSDRESLLNERFIETDNEKKSIFKMNLLRMDSWTAGETGGIIDGSRKLPQNGPRRAAGIGEIDAKQVVGKILVLEPESESESSASGTATYRYNVSLEGESPVAQDEENPYVETPFTLLWSADPQTITAVTDVPAGAQVTGVVYYNLAGVASLVPFEGVNIVVTNYDNGTTTVEKKINF